MASIWKQKVHLVQGINFKSHAGRDFNGKICFYNSGLCQNSQNNLIFENVILKMNLKKKLCINISNIKKKFINQKPSERN